jgi:uncharacterized protein with von Willebrand factor type A (vWA) domain
MRTRYSYLDPELIQRLLAEMGLRRLFNHLLLQTSGDVDEAMRWMRMLQERGYLDPDIDLDAFFAQMMQQNVIGQDGEGNHTLSAGGERQIRRDALDEIFGGLQKSVTGQHSVPNAGQGTERLTETRPYHFGDDPMSIDSSRTLQNVMKHTDPGDAIHITEDDLGSVRDRAPFELRHGGHDRHLALDDPLRRGPHHAGEESGAGVDGVDPDQVPEDAIDVLLFGDEATEVPISEIPYAQVGPYHTNTKAGLELAQRILRRPQAQQQADLHDHGRQAVGAVRERAALHELVRPGHEDRQPHAGRSGPLPPRRHPITTFMLATDPMLVNFVEQLSKINRGRAFYASADRLGEYILADYIRNRRKFVH